MIAWENGGLKENWLAFQLGIVKNISVDQALISMGLTRNRDGKGKIVRMTNDKVEIVLERLNKGEKLKDIAEDMGTTTKYIQSKIDKYNKNQDRYAAITTETLYQLYVVEDKTIKEVAEATGCCTEIASKLLKERGIKIRAIGGNHKKNKERRNLNVNK